MAGAADPYIRIYFRVRDDSRFEHAYSCDPCWAAYTRLLMDAEAAYPAPASLPRSLKAHAKKMLIEAGIIEFGPHDTFVVHGLTAERDIRSLQAADAAQRRWDKEYGRIAPEDATALLTHSDRIADPLLTDQSKEEQNKSEQIRAETSEAVSGPDAYCNVTLRFPQRGSTLYAWCDRLGDEFGADRFETALRCQFRADHSLKTLLSRTEASLSRESDRQERDRLAAARVPLRPVAVLPAEPITPEEEERLLAEYKAAHHA
jgi:hypothetical protein